MQSDEKGSCCLECGLKTLSGCSLEWLNSWELEVSFGVCSAVFSKKIFIVNNTCLNDLD